MVWSEGSNIRVVEIQDERRPIEKAYEKHWAGQADKLQAHDDGTAKEMSPGANRSIYTLSSPSLSRIPKLMTFKTNLTVRRILSKDFNLLDRKPRGLDSYQHLNSKKTSC